jgi:hypothetical protein
MGQVIVDTLWAIDRGPRDDLIRPRLWQTDR